MTSIIKRDAGRTNGNRLPAKGFNDVLDSFFQSNLNRFFDDRFWGGNSISVGNGVPVNLRETDASFELEAVAPGLQKEDFSLKLQGEHFTISFEHRETEGEGSEGEGYLRREFRRQSFSRTFHLDSNIDAGRISARYENGILYVSLPKKEEAQRITRNIEVA